MGEADPSSETLGHQVLPGEEEQEAQQQQVPGVHIVQVQLIQNMAEETCQTVGSRGRRRPSRA